MRPSWPPYRRPDERTRPCLTRDAAPRGPCDEPALEDDEEDGERRGGDDRDGHHYGPVGVVGASEVRQSQRQREVLLPTDVDQWLEEGVPAALEGEDGERRDRRHGVRQDDLDKHAVATRSIDSGRVLEFSR